jgi:hypothetical protein
MGLRGSRGVGGMLGCAGVGQEMVSTRGRGVADGVRGTFEFVVDVPEDGDGCWASMRGWGMVDGVRGVFEFVVDVPEDEDARETPDEMEGRLLLDVII